jgi:hypothetical protein
VSPVKKFLEPSYAFSLLQLVLLSLHLILLCVFFTMHDAAGRVVPSSPSLHDAVAGWSGGHKRVVVHEGDAEVFHLLYHAR